MLSKKYVVTEREYPETETFQKYTVRVKFMHGDADAYTHNDYGFDKQQDALEWYALWAGLAKEPRCYNGIVNYASWIIRNIEREKALFFFYTPDMQDKYLAKNFVQEHFLADADAFEDNFDNRLEEIEDILMNYFPADSTSLDHFAICDTVQFLRFDKETNKRREMRVSYA